MLGLLLTTMFTTAIKKKYMDSDGDGINDADDEDDDNDGIEDDEDDDDDGDGILDEDEDYDGDGIKNKHDDDDDGDGIKDKDDEDDDGDGVDDDGDEDDDDAPKAKATNSKTEVGGSSVGRMVFGYFFAITSYILKSQSA